MLKEDFVIQSNIRRILVRTNIDYSNLIFGTVKGTVYVRGTFRLVNYPGDEREVAVREYMAKTLRSLEKNIRSIPGVNDVIFQFINWKKEKGQWLPTEGQGEGGGNG